MSGVINPLMFFIKKAIYHSRFLNFGYRDYIAWLI